MKRLFLLVLALSYLTGCSGNNSSSDSPVASGSVEVTSTTDVYLQSFDVSLLDKDTMAYEIVVDKNIVLEDHIFEVTKQHVSHGEVTIDFDDQSQYEKMFNTQSVSKLKINYTVRLNEPGKYKVQVYPIFGVIDAEKLTIRVPLGVHIFIEKEVELLITYLDESLAFEVINHSDKQLGIFDATIRLEKMNGQEWIEVPLAEGIGFCGNASPFDENGSYGPYVFEDWFVFIEPGNYRLSLIVSDDLSIQHAQDSSRVYATFVVGE